MVEAAIALAFLVIAALLGQFLRPTVTSVITVASAHGFAAGDWVVINGQKARVSRIDNATSMTIVRRAG